MHQRIILITGGSRGLGKSAALKLAAKGADIILTYHSQQQEASGVIKEIQSMGRKAVAIQLNVGDISTFRQFVSDVRERLATVWQRDSFDGLLNNAGMGINASFAATTEAQFDQLMNVHLKGPFFLTQQLLPVLANGGRILNVSTGLTRFATPEKAAYAAMKGAMEVLTVHQAKELGYRGIAVNIIAPGAIATDFGGGEVRDNAQRAQAIASQTALGRVGQPDDIGQAIAAILSEDTGWINAQRIEVSGGMFL
ncbi:SDR family oxidoreductase [Citrobacter sp. JGM124]|uniref:SDR family NAD(P)-dependent oxidoreductase n=1 Tax=Citrobacter sp. JGM124 TaxID=2799789 RepID=UPI001BAC965E|nr:SDR family oxidoreductase [Citrobacter sp. JGM124]MBS0848098.1 SDR family oxidoreductase [Citrobacter sp. JGM124]